MSSTHDQAKAFFDDIGRGTGKVSWEVAKMVNALVKAAKAEHPDNAVLAAVDELQRQGQAEAKYVTYVDVRVIVGQVKLATEPVKEPDAVERIRLDREERLRRDRG